jgi:magnesium transporter
MTISQAGQNTVGSENRRLSFETAAQHATRNVPLADSGQRIGDVREMLVGRRYDSASHVVVCEGDQFRGVMTVEDVLAAPVDATVESVMDPRAPIVVPGTDQEVAAWQAVKHEESALSGSIAYRLLYLAHVPVLGVPQLTK